MSKLKAAKPVEEERRQRTRRRVNSPAWADPGGVLPVIDCKIMDLSEDGARIATPKNLQLPDDFLLQIDNSRILGQAQVIWRTDDVVGVKLVRRA